MPVAGHFEGPDGRFVAHGGSLGQPGGAEERPLEGERGLPLLVDLAGAGQRLGQTTGRPARTAAEPVPVTREDVLAACRTAAEGPLAGVLEIDTLNLLAAG
ncbi:hypothetical protein [Streptomyces sp. NPDC056144]|uniref:hypothetical protein n=1 Tax=unclassified Streptomyces TaxID=2593676 RepID=UPI0035DC56E6